MSLNFYCEEENENNKEVSLNNYKYIFSNYEKNIPSLSEALIQMYKSLNLDDYIIKELTKEIIEKCKERIDNKFDLIKLKYTNITKEDAYIICSYTYETKIKEFSPYKILNINLTSEDRKNGVRNISKYLYILLKTLRKIPRYYPKDNYLYRCLTIQVNISQDNNKNSLYFKGNKKTFWGFTSTSQDPKITYSFLNKEEKIKTGTVFTLGGDLWGYDIELFNYYHEKEILLEPERKFIVTEILPPLNGIINIRCNISKTGLVLSDDKLEPSSISYNTEEFENKDNTNIKEYIIKYEMETKKNEEIIYTKGIGILCNIPTKNIKALITYNHMINFDVLNNGKKMILYINKKEHEINIKIDRYKYTNEDLDITIIEILDTDNIKSFIEIDKFINSKNYIDSDIISVSLKKDNQLELLDGIIIGKNNDNYESNIESVKKGIIVLKDNMKLIGMIKEKNDKIIIIPLNIIINKINFIKCVYEIKKDDINKEIQIINNKYKNDDKIRNEEIQNKVKIIINGEIESNILKYKFNIEGDYIIYLISYNDLTDMSYMFYNCSSLKELNLSSFNTNQVTNMLWMFDNCSSLKKLNLSSFNTNQVTNMTCMFGSCCSLKELNLSSFNTKLVTNMSSMFRNCTSLEELNLSSFDTSQVTDLSNMFRDCSSLQELNLSSFNTNKVTNMHNMFRNCSSLRELNLSSFNTNQVIYMQKIFNSINKSCKLKCKDIQILKAFKTSTDCIMI